MTGSALRAALRIARREAWRAKGRSLLVIALIGLPVFILTIADIGFRTWQLDPSEKIVRTIGAADAGVRWPGGGSVTQTPAAWLGDSFDTSDNGASATPTTASVQAAFPGSRIIPIVQGFQQLTIRTAAGIKRTDQIGLDYADPIAHGLVRQVSGRAPRTTTEVALSQSLARSVGLHVGATLQLQDPARRLTVVGIVTDATHRTAQAAYTLPAAVAGVSSPAIFAQSTTWLVQTPQPVSWSQVLQQNRLGLMVLSRSAYLHPPPTSQIPDVPGGQVSTRTVATLSLVAGMALLEVVLLAGPAFAVSARRQRRDLALIAAVGGRRSNLRNVVLANGLVLGVTAGVLAVLGAVVVTAVGVPLIASHVATVPGHYDARALELGGLAVVSLVTALLAAAFPARTAARTDVVAALAGRRGAVRTRGWVPVLGLVLAGLGALIAIAGATTGSGYQAILAGVALVEFGLIICTPALLGLAARLGAHLPLAPRIAVRDAGRNRSAATPAVAAVMASVIGAVSIAIAVTSTNDLNRRSYQPSLPRHDAYVRLAASGTADAVAQSTAVASTLRATLPGTTVAVVSGTSDSCDFETDPTRACRTWDITPDVSTPFATTYFGGLLPATVIDDGSNVAALFGTPVPAAAAALRAGKVVVANPALMVNGTVALSGTATVSYPQSDAAPPPPTTTSLTVDAVAVTAGVAPSVLVVPPSVASRLGVPVQVAGVLVQQSHSPTDHQTQVINGQLNRLSPDLSMYVENGYHDPNEWQLLALIAAAAVIAIGAALIATALANVDSRADLTTLASVGASPRTRRVLSMSRAATVAAIGSVIGVAAGFVPAYAWVHASTRSAPGYATYGGPYSQVVREAALRLVVPWLPIAAALVGIPLVAALGAGLFTRSRLPSERPAG